MFTGEGTKKKTIYLDVHPSLVMLLKSSQVEQEWTESTMNKTLFSRYLAKIHH